MGKASRKMKKKQQQEAEAGLQAEVKTTEQKLFRQIEEEAYSEALDTLVELVQKKSVSPQAMYAGAYAYFMMGDYDRAANWIDNTLARDVLERIHNLLRTFEMVFMFDITAQLRIINVIPFSPPSRRSPWQISIHIRAVCHIVVGEPSKKFLVVLYRFLGVRNGLCRLFCQIAVLIYRHGKFRLMPFKSEIYNNCQPSFFILERASCNRLDFVIVYRHNTSGVINFI